ncbi:hypothetical protein L6R46_04390 [Myxococcota bacterium]|nr:hypothetical protein [Myxococcota bacterium]
MLRQVFWILALLLVAAPVWGADLQVGDLRLLGLSADTLALLGAASVLARALARLEAWRPVIRVELVEPSSPNVPPPVAPAAPAPAGGGLALVRAAAAGLVLLLVGGCVSSTADTSDTAPEGLAVAVGCQNHPREWGVTWQTAEDLGWIELVAETPSSSSSTTVTDPCGLWRTGLSCDEPVAALGRLYQRLSSIEACAQTANDGSTPYGASCPATFDPILCE